MDGIDKARREGRKNLTEFEAKAVLRHYGIPVVRERLVCRREELSEAVRDIGFPMVMKGCAPELTHKTEFGMVALDIRGEREAQEAFERMMQALPVGEPSVLIQEMIRGKRELAAGLVRDAQFGPTVMFGLGGIFTEILSDVVFRLAPFDRDEALAMIGEIRSRKILDAVRGMEAVDLPVLADSLVRIGRIALECPDIAEIDINPFIVSGGVPVAVDALIVLR